MENHFNTPAEVVDLSIKACENKTKLPVGKMILLGIMAGVFIALGGATSSTAAHAVENVGVARALAGVIFPVGLMRSPMRMGSVPIVTACVYEETTVSSFCFGNV